MSESCKQVKKSSTDADNQRIPMANGAVQQMTPLKVAKKLETVGELIWKNNDVGIFLFTRKDAEVLNAALSYVQRVASGEYKPVVHAWWHIESGIGYYCSHCGAGEYEDDSKYCPNCGALMDGKDDSHE
jgi:hypothetical protein